jgi:predicted dehydrogenase
VPRREGAGVKIAVLGCGYVAEQYANTLGVHPELTLAGAYDHDAQRLAAFTERTRARAYASFDDLLADSTVELVLNLTNPRSHFELNRRCLEAGKHVYSEKPLAMTSAEARQLAEIAGARSLTLAAAPCSVLSETAQTLGKAIRDGAIGPVRLVYANFDDGMIAPNQSPWEWRNANGVPWPARDEFEVGCTYEHAGYVLTWLCAFFGPARAVTAFASVQLQDKGIPVDVMAPDFTVGCIEFDHGIVARVTCGLVAPRDKSFTVIGDGGTLFVGNVRDESAPVMWRRSRPSRLSSAITRRSRWLHRWLEARVPGATVEALLARPYPFAKRPSAVAAAEGKAVDFLRGPSEVAEAIRERRPSRLSADFGVHIVEIVEALQYPERTGQRKLIDSTFAGMAPLAWAR